MTTPYDAALRLGQREIDDMRVLIRAQIDQLAALERHCDAVDQSVQHELSTVDRLSGFSSYPFLARMRTRRLALADERAAADAHLTGLRLRAAEAFGALSAVKSAAERHRIEAYRIAATAEQAGIDDFSASRFNRAREAARRALSQTTADLG